MGGSSLGYPQRELVIRFGDLDEDCIEVGPPGASVSARQMLVAAAFRAFADEVLARAGMPAAGEKEDAR